MIIVKTPLRISLLGGSTDYLPWYSQHGGCVLGGTINKYSYVQVQQLENYYGYKSRIIYSEIEKVHNNREIKHNYVRKILDYMKLNDLSLEMIYTSDLPSRTGLGSSSAFITGLHLALSKLTGKVKAGEDYLWEDLETSVAYIEQHVLEETVGIQDRLFAIWGGFCYYQIYRDGSYLRTYFLKEKIYKLNKYSLLFFLGGRQETASNLASTYVNNLLNYEESMKHLMRITQLGVEHLRNGDMEGLGNMVGTGWLIKKSLSPNISKNWIDRLYQYALDAGAWGGKLTGAGGPTCLYLIAPPESHSRIRSLMKENNFAEIPFEFDVENSGSEVIHGR